MMVELERLFGDEIEQFEDRDGTDEVVMLRTVRQQQSLSSHGSNSVLSSSHSHASADAEH